MSTKIRSFMDLVRLFSKNFNPRVTREIEAGKSPFSLILHTGRKSGKPYRTPVDATFLGDFLLITLPYRTRSDWTKNVLFAGGCKVVHKGQTFTATQPRVLPAEEAVGLMPGRKTTPSIKEYLRMSISPAYEPES
jgi:deazaflavin-dependent oxidoreductase (nitroreductase family)